MDKIIRLANLFEVIVKIADSDSSDFSFNKSIRNMRIQQYTSCLSTLLMKLIYGNDVSEKSYEIKLKPKPWK